jgi:hypothetical protein
VAHDSVYMGEGGRDGGWGGECDLSLLVYIFVCNKWSYCGSLDTVRPPVV